MKKRTQEKIIIIKIILFIIHVISSLTLSLIIPIIFILVNGIEHYINDETHLFPYFIIPISTIEFCRFVIEIILLSLLIFIKFFFPNIKENLLYYFYELLIIFLWAGFTTKSWLYFVIYLNMKNQSTCTENDFIDLLCIISSPWKLGYKWYLYVLHLFCFIFLFIDMIYKMIYLSLLMFEIIYMIVTRNKVVIKIPLLEQTKIKFDGDNINKLIDDDDEDELSKTYDI